MLKVIGGEFDLDISKLGKNPTQTPMNLFSSGRAALYHIICSVSQSSSIDIILLPDYLCDSIIHAVQKTEIKFEFYRINYDLSIDFQDLETKVSDTSIVLLINYFGCVDIKNQIQKARTINDNCVIISDNVQAYFAMDQTNDADYSFTSFRKIFAVPDGAIIQTKHKAIPSSNKENTFVAAKIAGGVLKHYAARNSFDDALYLNYLSFGENQIEQNYDAVASDFSQNLMQTLDLKAIAAIRIENAAFIKKGLKDLGISPIVSNTEQQVPLFIPIRLKNRDAIRKEMFSNNIFCPVHWPLPKGFELLRGQELAQTELSLIIDQRYTTEDLQRILDILKNAEQ